MTFMVKIETVSEIKQIPKTDFIDLPLRLEAGYCPPFVVLRIMAGGGPPLNGFL